MAKQTREQDAQAGRSGNRADKPVRMHAASTALPSIYFIHSMLLLHASPAMAVIITALSSIFSMQSMSLLCVNLVSCVFSIVDRQY